MENCSARQRKEPGTNVHCAERRNIQPLFFCWNDKFPVEASGLQWICILPIRLFELCEYFDLFSALKLCLGFKNVHSVRFFVCFWINLCCNLSLLSAASVSQTRNTLFKFLSTTGLKVQTDHLSHAQRCVFTWRILCHLYRFVVLNWKLNFAIWSVEIEENCFVAAKTAGFCDTVESQMVWNMVFLCFLPSSLTFLI